MATFTITTDVNIDSLTSKTGGDTYNINGGVLTIDQHSRYGVEQNTSAILGPVTLSATLGGTIKIRGDKVRLIPYDGGSGNVPAVGTTISGATGSGKLIGVYDTLAVAPTTAGSAMPADGYILIRQWNDGAFIDNEALSGLTANVTTDPVFGGTDRVGWLEIVGEETRSITTNRINNITDDEMIGDWFYVGITDGTRTTSYQIPSNGSAQWIPGVQVETSAGSGVYEWWPVTNASMTSANLDTTGERSKVCYVNTSTGQLYFGYDGTNSSGGQCPTSGRKVRIGNIICQSATAAARTTNSLNSTVTTRFRPLTTGSGQWRETKVTSAWGHASLTNAYAVEIIDSAIAGHTIITNNATPFVMENSCMSVVHTETSGTAHPFNVSNSTQGGTITDSVIHVGDMSGAARNGLHINISENVTVTDSKILGSGATTGSPTAINFNQVFSISISNVVTSAGTFNVSQASDWSIENITFTMTGGDPYINASSAVLWTIANTSSNGIIDGFEMPVAEQGAKGVMFSVTGSCSGIKIRNVGTYNSPLMMRGSIHENISWSRSTTTVTVTHTAHGLRVGDTVNLVRTSQSATGGVGTGGSSFAVASVPTADTFTLTVTNSGDTSGTLSYYRSWATTILSIAAGCTDIEAQNIHIRGNRSDPISTVNTSSDVRIYNLTGDYWLGATTASNDMVTRGIQGNAGLPAATSSQFGHTFMDSHTRETSVTALQNITWTRTSNVITGTLTNHGFSTLQNRIRIYDSSDQTTIPNGWKSGFRVIDKDTFVFTGVGSGATSGTAKLFYEDSRLTLFMNEESEAISTYTIDSGSPAFTGAGTLSMPNSGDQLTWEMPAYLINHTGFDVMLPFTNLGEIAANMGVFDVTYDIAKDDGAFSGSFKNLIYARTGSAGSSGSPIVTVADTTGVAVGDYVFGAGVALGAKVVSIDSSTQLTLNTNNLATVGSVLFFDHLPNETFTDNYKLKVRIRANQNNTQALSYLIIPLTSDATSRAREYPIAVSGVQTVTLTNGVAGSRVQIKDLTSDTQLVNEVVSSFPFTWTDTNSYVADREIRVRVAYVNGDEAKEFIDAVIGTATEDNLDLSYRLNQVDDEVYNANAIDGSAVTGMVINDDDALFELEEDITAPQIYAKAMYTLYTEDGIRELGQTIFGIDQANYRLSGRMLKNVSSPAAPVIISGGWIIDAVTGQLADTIDTSGTQGIYPQVDHVVPFSTSGDVVISGDISDIPAELADDFAAIPTAAENATAVESALSDEFAAIPTAQEVADAVDENQKLPNLLIKDKLS